MSMQRIINSVKADIKFQFKHGFYTVYIVLSIAYLIVLSFIPYSALKIVLPILIYTDPAGLGLFFIGGMVLLEKEQGVLALLYITPLKVYEYIMSKTLTLGMISALVGFVLSLVSYGLEANYILLFIGTFFVSIFYTLIGFIVASRSKSVNVYLVKMIPIMLLTILPCLSFILNDIIPQFVNRLLLFIPSAGGLKLVMGAYSSIASLDIIISILGLVVFNMFLINKVSKILTDKVILNS